MPLLPSSSSSFLIGMMSRTSVSHSSVVQFHPALPGTWPWSYAVVSTSTSTMRTLASFACCATQSVVTRTSATADSFHDLSRRSRDSSAVACGAKAEAAEADILYGRRHPRTRFANASYAPGARWFHHWTYAADTVSRFFHSMGLDTALRYSGAMSRTRSQTNRNSRLLWKNSSWFRTPLVTNDAAISQYDVSILYDAFGSLPGGQITLNSSIVFGLECVAYQIGKG